METALPYGGGTVELRFLLLPETDDPDTFVRSRGAGRLPGAGGRGPPLSDFLVKELAERVDFGTVDGRARFDGDREAAAARGCRKEPTASRYGRAGGTSCDLRRAVFEQLMADGAAAAADASRAEAGAIKRKTAVQKVINLALHYPRAAAQVADAELLALLNQPGADLLRRVFAAAVAARTLRTPRGYWKTCAATPICSYLAANRGRAPARDRRRRPPPPRSSRSLSSNPA